jgi:hypothetical protein
MVEAQILYGNNCEEKGLVILGLELRFIDRVARSRSLFRLPRLLLQHVRMELLPTHILPS